MSRRTVFWYHLILCAEVSLATRKCLCCSNQISLKSKGTSLWCQSNGVTPLPGLLTKRMDVFMSLGFWMLLWMSSYENLNFSAIGFFHVGVLKNMQYKTFDNRYLSNIYIYATLCDIDSFCLSTFQIVFYRSLFVCQLEFHHPRVKSQVTFDQPSPQGSSPHQWSKNHPPSSLQETFVWNEKRQFFSHPPKLDFLRYPLHPALDVQILGSASESRWLGVQQVTQRFDQGRWVEMSYVSTENTWHVFFVKHWWWW